MHKILQALNIAHQNLTGVPVRHQPPLSLPSEFALAAACCRWASSGEGAVEIGRRAAGADWGAFLEVCRRHRVQGLALRALSDLQIAMLPPVHVALGADARGIAEHGLRAAAESQRLHETFAAAGVPILFLKGLTLGKLAYGDPFLKMGWDVDVLVAPSDIQNAAILLGQLGYQVIAPRQVCELARWHGSHKESVWRSPIALTIELHSRVADQPQLLPGLSFNSPSQMVAVAPGIALPTFADAELFAYLCVHGASSAWFRLKWISDLAGMVHGRDADAIESLHGRAHELGAGRAADQALLLAHWLFDIPISEGLARSLAAPITRWLARAAFRDLLRGEPTERVLGTRTIHLTQFFMLPGFSYKISELFRQARAAISLR
jgi:hypothetical protein